MSIQKSTDITKSYNLEQTVREHTRVTVNSSAIVDNIFTSAEENKITAITSALADHFAQQISILNEHSNQESLKDRKMLWRKQKKSRYYRIKLGITHR